MSASARTDTPVFAPAWPMLERDYVDVEISRPGVHSELETERIVALWCPPGRTSGAGPDRVQPRCLSADNLKNVLA